MLIYQKLLRPTWSSYLQCYQEKIQVVNLIAFAIVTSEIMGWLLTWFIYYLPLSQEAEFPHSFRSITKIKKSVDISQALRGSEYWLLDERDTCIDLRGIHLLKVIH